MELRKDYLVDHWVIVSDFRGKRPHEFKKDEKLDQEKTIDGTKNNRAVCYFCPGNEHLTPPEIYRITKNGNWQIRVFPNKFPAVAPEGQSEIKTDNDFFTFANPYGRHEVIVETPEHGRQTADLSEEELHDLLGVYNFRLKELANLPNAKYVVLFKNHGKSGGASLSHSHTQILSLNKVPGFVEKEINAAKGWRQARNECPYCKIINIEKGSFRRCFESTYFIAFTPYASRFNYEVWLFPKQHCKSPTELNYVEMKDFTSIFKKILAKIKELGADYNFYLHHSPLGEDLHFHFEFAPRMENWAGFELGTETVINSVPPEDAAKFYRGEV